MIEIVGLAGAGKSSLMAEIQRQRQVEYQDSIYNIKSFLSISWILIYSLFASLRYAPKTKFWLMNVRAIFWLNKILYGPSMYSGKVFDQGPIFQIAFLRSIGAEYDSSRFCKKYYAELVEQLAKKLTGVVLLEVDFETAIERSQNRQKKHSLQHRSKDSALEFLAFFQVEYDALTEHLENMGVKILKIDTLANSESEVFCQFKRNFSGYLNV